MAMNNFMQISHQWLQTNLLQSTEEISRQQLNEQLRWLLQFLARPNIHESAARDMVRTAKVVLLAVIPPARRDPDMIFRNALQTSTDACFKVTRVKSSVGSMRTKISALYFRSDLETRLATESNRHHGKNNCNNFAAIEQQEHSGGAHLHSRALHGAVDARHLCPIIGSFSIIEKGEK
jgi:hypothetical protein